MKKNDAGKESSDLKIKRFISNHINYIYLLALIFSLVIIYKLFDIKVNLAGDDSAYILRAYELLHNGRFPSWQGPLYPMALSVFVAIFGISVPILKITSGIFLLTSFYILFRALRDRISNFLLIFTIFAVSLNSFLLYYGYYTFSEAFYMLVQAALFLVLFKTISSEQGSSIRVLVLTGVLAYMLYLTRTVGIAGILAIVLYFITKNDFKKLGITIASFGGAHALFSLSKRLIWGSQGIQFNGQLNSLLQKNAYNPAMGNEDLMGFLGRLVDNSNLYISKHIFRFLSLRSLTANTIEPILTILVYLILLVGFIYAARKSKFLLFLFLYTGAFCLITFVSLQKSWDQDRLIAPIFPVMVLLLAYSLLSIFEFKWLKNLRFIPYIFLIALPFLILKTSGTRISLSQRVHEESMKGNQFFGYTPDWENYLRMSQYAGKIAGDDLVACRKPANSFIYAKKIFKGIYTVPILEKDSVFRPNMTYYSLMLSDKNARFFNRSMIKAVFSGTAATDNFKSNRAYYLFETNSTSPVQSLDTYKINRQIFEESFSAVTLYSPDQLVNELKHTNTRYIISANLRRNPMKKTSNTIDTVERYIQIISTKYPHFFTKVHEIGKDEKAFLYKLNY
ncbi:glycosyltransferase family protein [Mangrovibacterium lignilyticum]|uniref:hypothetical protein n=1 Tax=Mangrovibacterium lignilyticum TaxID=2668052 RepID=UPI0013D16F16|nr:hypothetical protein [Mangrovibacterium lignilyticum]